MGCRDPDVVIPTSLNTSLALCALMRFHTRTLSSSMVHLLRFLLRISNVVQTTRDFSSSLIHLNVLRTREGDDLSGSDDVLVSSLHGRAAAESHLFL